MQKKVIAVVVTYNRLELLKHCIEKILKQNYLCDVLIIDNCSTDKTKEYIKNKYHVNKKVFYYRTKQNIGGAGGFNIGIRLAIKYKYDFIWIMDDDCMPLKNTLQEFINFEENNHGQYGFLSSKVLWKDNTICNMNIQRQNVYFKVKDFNSKQVKISMASFVSLFIPTKIVENVGLPIKDFFIWTDDWEYTRRISLKYDCFLLNKSVVFHYCNDNIGANISKTAEKRLDRFKYLYRNDVYLYRREGIKGFLYEILRILLHISRVILYADNNKIKRIKIIINSSLKGLYFNPSIEKIKS